MVMRKIILASVALLCFTATHAQTDCSATKTIIRTAADLKSGNSQDVFTSFFQLAANDLTGQNKSFSFQSTLFGIKAKTDSTLWTDTNYLRKSFARNFSVGVAALLDSAYKFSGNTLSFKYAICNKRDKTVHDFSLDYPNIEQEWNNIKTKSVTDYFNTNPESKDRITAANFFDDEEGVSADQLPEKYKEILTSTLKESKYFSGWDIKKFRNQLKVLYDSISNIVDNKPLWTVATDFTSNADGKIFSAIKCNTEFLKGIINTKSFSSIQLDLKGNLAFDDDSTKAGSDLNRQTLSFSAGFNWIMARTKNTNKSILEFKGSAEKNFILNGLYTGEKDNSFTLNGTLRLRITDDLWIPFSVKYNPDNKGNVFGFLSIKANFDMLGEKLNFLKN